MPPLTPNLDISASEPERCRRGGRNSENRHTESPRSNGIYPTKDSIAGPSNLVSVGETDKMGTTMTKGEPQLYFRRSRTGQSETPSNALRHCGLMPLQVA